AGTLNTTVLITSSLTMALAGRAAQLSQQKQLVRYLGITFVLAGVFLVVKYFEYSAKIHHGLLPIEGYWRPEQVAEIFGDTQIGHARIYFAFYFVMTGLHGLHVIIGMGVILWVLVKGKN